MNYCSHTDTINRQCQDICTDCGLVVSSDLFIVQEFHKHEPYVFQSHPNKFTKFLWSPDDKAQYKIKTITQDICRTLNVSEHLVADICNLSIYTLQTVSKLDSSKRGVLKNAIIYLCIHYIHNRYNIPFTLNIDKHIIKANNIILELIHLDTSFDLDPRFLLQQPNSYDLVHNSPKLQSALGGDFNLIMSKTQDLIDICEDNDLLITHTPLSIGVGCLFFILHKLDHVIDVTDLVQIFNITSITVHKIYSKLSIHNSKLYKLLEM